MEYKSLKNSLLQLNNDELQKLAKEFGIPTNDKNDIAWLLSIKLLTKRAHMTDDDTEEDPNDEYFLTSESITSSITSDYCELYDIIPDADILSCQEFSDRYTFVKELGSGKFGVVNEYIDNQTTETVAIKMLYYVPDQEWVYSAEYTILQSLQKMSCTENVMCYKNHFIVEDCQDSPCVFCIVFEDLKGGSLKQIIKQYIPTAKIKKIFCGLVSGLNYLHTNGIAHRDLHLGNVMFRDDLTPVIIDFGLSCIPASGDCISTRTNALMSRQEYFVKLIQNKPITNKDIYDNDIYALLTMFYQILSRDTTPPLKEFSENVTRPLFQKGKGSIKKYINKVENIKIGTTAQDLYPEDLELAETVLGYINADVMPSLGELSMAFC